MAATHTSLVAALRAFIRSAEKRVSWILPSPEELRDHEREQPSLSNGRPFYVNGPRWELRSAVKDRHALVAELRQTRELFAVMNVLARLDRQGWIEDADKLWYTLQEYQDTTEPFSAGVHLDLSVLNALREVEMPPPSPECVALLQRVRDEASAKVDVAECCQVPLRFLVECQVWAIKYDKTTTAELQEILDYARGLQATRVAPTRSSPSFVVREIAFEHSFGLHVSKHMLGVVHELAECGVTMRDVGAIKSEPSQKVFETLQLLLPSHLTTRGTGTRSVVVHGPKAVACAPAILSAVQQSRSVHRVVVSHRHYYKEQIPTEVWRWVAYGLFSRHANHQVKTFEIDDETTFTEKDVEAMREVIESEDPLAVVLGEAPCFSVETVFVRASRFYLDEAGNTGGSIFTSRESLVCRGWRKAVNGWRVLVPGFGVAWVRQEDGEVVPAPVSIALPPLEVVAKHMHPSEDNWRMLLELLSDRIHAVRVDQLGPSRYEEESGSEDEYDEEDEDEEENDEEDDEATEVDAFAQVMSLCPKIQELKVKRGIVRNFNIFAEYAAVATGPRLTKLELTERIKEDTSFRGLVTFFKALADSTHPLSNSLEVLSLWLNVPHRLNRRLTELICEMLDKNRRLNSVYFDFKLRGNIGLEDEMAAEFGSRGDDPVVVAAGTVDLKSKLALLSAMPSNQAASSLDTNLLAKIFEFAAPSRNRDFQYCLEA